MTSNPIEYLWKDRKRFLGMPLSFTRYRLSNDRLFLETGVLSMKEDEIILYRVRDLSLSISLWQRLFGVGTVTISSSDKSMPSLVLKNIKHPREVKELIHQQVEQMKIARRLRVGEILSDHDDDDDDDDDFDDGFGHSR